MIASRALFPLLTGLFAILCGPARAQWIRQSPIPTGLAVEGVGFFSSEHGFLATNDSAWDDGGALFETLDGGATWVQLDVPVGGGSLNGLTFLDGQLGWLFGNDNYRTTDAGKSWLPMPFLGSTYAMRFFTEDFGYASSNGGLYVSRNGGVSWSPSPNGMFAFDFRDDLTGLGGSTNGLYRTTDGGQNFALVRSGNVAAVTFLSGDVAVAIADGSLLRSADAGQTWTSVAAASQRNRLQAVSAEVVIAWRRDSPYPVPDGRLLRSADGGLTWTDLGNVIPGGTADFVVTAAGSVFVADLGADVYRSLDAGENWKLVHDAPFFGAVDGALAFPDDQTGYLAYREGLVFKTSDGGDTWRQISNGFGASLSDVDRFDDGRLIAVGFEGAVLTSDDGRTWKAGSTGTLDRLESVDVVDADHVVAMAEDGLVYRSADRGLTWTAGTARPDPFAEFLAYDLWFGTPLDGWVVGTRFNFPAVYHTTDGGDSWTVGAPNPGLFVGVDFVGTHGWIVDNGGGLLRTTDSGQTWALSFLPGGFMDLLDIEFHDQNVGYAVGWYGYAARTSDGGQSWTVLPTPNEDDRLSDLYLLGPNDVWASTYDDRAYHSTDGGLTWEVLELFSAPETFGSFSGIVAEPNGRAWTVGWLGHVYVDREAKGPTSMQRGRR